MNIMLVAVRERTREIGVRKALGATTRQVQRQFFLEGFLLTMFSGAIGFAAALALCAAVKLHAECRGFRVRELSHANLDLAHRSERGELVLAEEELRPDLGEAGVKVEVEACGCLHRSDSVGKSLPPGPRDEDGLGLRRSGPACRAR
jgi:hypothetical protein